MQAPTRQEINEAAMAARMSESNAISEKLITEGEQAEAARQTHANRKRTPLKSLLAAFEKAEKLRGETEALKPRLEREIAASMDTGDALNETLAHGVQIKRLQLELVPVKLEQIRLRLEDLTSQMQAEFNDRFTAYGRQFEGVRRIVHQHFDDFIRPLMADDFMVEAIITNMLIPNTKINRRVLSELAYISQRMSVGDVPGAVRELLKREPEAAAILAEAEKMAKQSAK